MALKVGIIGYGNHARRLATIIDNIENIEIIKVFHPSKDLGIDTSTNSFSDLFECDCVIIASPNNTHYDYLMRLLPNFSGYVFCEKPPVSSQTELDELKKFSPEFRKRLFFNFNYRFSDISKTIHDNSDSKVMGKLSHINIISTHGLAYKKEYLNSWRANGKENLHNILDTVSIHYIDLLCLYFGSIKNIQYSPTLISNNGTSYDTCNLLIQFQNGQSSMIFNSYAFPYLYEITLIGTNGYTTIRDDKSTQFSPRDTFDSNDSFITPPISNESEFSLNSDYISSLKNSMEYFLSKVQSKSDIEENYFDTSIRSNQIILDLHSKKF